MRFEGDMKLDERLENEISALVADEGLELLAGEVRGSGQKTVLRLVIDGPEGITLDNCSTISRQASAILDVGDPIGHAYTLEVTSPGLDRKLYKAQDYERFAGSRVNIRMQPSYRDHRVVVGELLGFDGESVRLRLDSSEVLELPHESVFEARIEVDWSAIMKEGKSRP
jgi:ribosome maturation factor RimP